MEEYPWTNLVASVICQPRNDGSLGKTDIAKDWQLQKMGGS